MKTVITIILVLMIFLAISSGITKIMLLPQEVAFFGAYGFTSPLLILFGANQIVGGIFLVFAKLRIAGALIITITFLISLVLLILAANILFSIITTIAILLLALLIKFSRKTTPV